MAEPQILVMGQIYWAQEQCKRLLEGVAEVIVRHTTSLECAISALLICRVSVYAIQDAC